MVVSLVGVKELLLVVLKVVETVVLMVSSLVLLSVDELADVTVVLLVGEKDDEKVDQQVGS